jgi:DNA-binding NtrC family response regulator/tetratricopeptide (TPR) repeat protein
MANANIHALIETGRFREASTAINAQGDLSPSLRVVRAQLETHLGSPVSACDQAKALLRERLDDEDEIHCHEIVGRTAMAMGQPETGMKAMRAALALAVRSQSQKLIARLSVSNAEALLHWGAVEPAVVEIAKVRRVCAAAGDPYSLIALHKLVAEIKSKTGLGASAREDIKTARTLLSDWPNCWLEGRVAVTASAIEFMEADYESAFLFASEALQCADKSGSREIRVPALANLANIQRIQGRLDQARQSIDEFFSIVKKGGNAEIGGLDTATEIALAANDLELATALSERATNLSEGLGQGNSYHGLWHVLTKIKLLYRKEQLEAGISLALDSLPRMRRTADRNMLERVQLLAAEGLAIVGRVDEAAALLSAAFNENPYPSLEIMGEISRVAGCLSAAHDPDGARKHFDRAHRILETIGSVAATANVRRTRESCLGRQTDNDTLPDQNTTLTARSAENLFDVATILELSTHPILLGTEVLSLLSQSQGATSAAVISGAASGEGVIARYSGSGLSDFVSSQPPIRISLGVFRGQEHFISIVPSPTASSRSTVLAIERLIQAARSLEESRQERRERAFVWPEQTSQQELGVVCASERTLELITLLKRAAATPLTVLITGETGVGKELYARAVHVASPRKDAAFLPFNCSTVPKDMFDSHLFGHRKGAFTGANDHGVGVVRAAAGGTLFLDEIGDMAVDAQPKLLRFLESGEIHPLGEPKPTHVDVRIVAATNTSLEQLVSEGKFREDLYYRLNVLAIHIPPLRERREEIPALVDHFVDKFRREMHKPMLQVADETLEYLLLYRWPGNVRQLANEIRRMVALAEPGATLTPAHLSKEIVGSRRTMPVEPSEFVLRLDQPLADATDQLERAAIERAMTACKGSIDQAAKVLGLSRKGLYLKRQRLGLK